MRLNFLNDLLNKYYVRLYYDLLFVYTQHIWILVRLFFSLLKNTHIHINNHSRLNE